MKFVLSTALFGTCLGLGACASGTASLRGGPQDYTVDNGKIVAVNQWAQTKGATVLWIHYPVRLKDADETNR